MRIISGHAKGRKLFGPSNNKAIRPTSDRAREALFNILSEHIPGAQVLDLFAGTGAFGVEALSRGAESCTFIDTNNGAIGLIKKNTSLILDSASRGHFSIPSIKIIKRDLNKTDLLNIFELPDFSTFSVIFLDPPYSKGLVHKTLSKLDKYEHLHQKVIIIAEERSTEKAPDDFNQLSLTDSRKYGDTVFWFYSAQAK